MDHSYVERVVDLTDPEANQIYNLTVEQARHLLLEEPAEAVRGIQGSFALLARSGKTVKMARSLDRPMRYFLAKRQEGPALVVAHRIDAIFEWLKSEGLDGQFHPSYTRMVPAHYVVELQLIGCPDPDPVYRRFFAPASATLPKVLDAIGRTYISVLADEIAQWLKVIPAKEPIGVCFSGGIDSGSVFLTTYHVMRELGMSPSRLKAFVLDLGEGPDLRQAQSFLEQLGLAIFLETIEVDPTTLNPEETVRLLEDYKPLDIESATMAIALCRGIRNQYPEWRYLIDGDGGDENLKDYPIEENPELTIRSVINNQMLYQEGWGVGTIKHSLTYSGGLSRSYIRTYAPAHFYGFNGFSPYTRPDVIAVAESIAFIDQTNYVLAQPLRPQGRHCRAWSRSGNGNEDAGVRQAALPAWSYAGRVASPSLAAAGSRVSQTVSLSLPMSVAQLSIYPEGRTERDRWILARRPARNVVDPSRPYHFFVEEEPSATGELVQVATVLLTNRECPWRCLMCDLWQNTLTEPLLVGAIPAQIDHALKQLPKARHIKLYNSGSFFDPAAIPPHDYPEIADLLGGFERVIVESHPALIDERCSRFKELLSGRLEVAMGLETAHPLILERLNKRMTLESFSEAAEGLRKHDIDLRAFILVKPPFMKEEESLEWAERSLDFAFDCGAGAVILIPTRDGNGALEELSLSGDFAPPKLSTLEQAVAYGLSLTRGRVFVDLWNIDRLARCCYCDESRFARLKWINLNQAIPGAVLCDRCEGRAG